ncbi:hypothetical protein, conserved [Plasmodium gonderi]|uniref:SPX domain-containing protein n=1 Tax=Plasmodium gonderi TaxID=77519 RepID=A0A1Y1JQ99_PLAGO|nr:hypothetical protein, conserved [Plasmodium gonderi]GAW83678.1 hypothetical protein, conserved [Plasmodium gonderi]
MKFSKKLHEKAHPKYKKYYIAYKELKKAIRLITGKDTSTFTIKEVTSNFGSIRALSGEEYKSAESRFQDILNAELDKINKFTRNTIKEWYDEAEFCLNKLRKEDSLIDLHEITKKLNELGNTLKFLESYRIVNFIGFRKITKKFDKHNDKGVSSSFYINVIIKSFFMNFDVNFLIYILSVCYKYSRTIRGKTASTKDEQQLPVSELPPQESLKLIDVETDEHDKSSLSNNLKRKKYISRNIEAQECSSDSGDEKKESNIRVQRNNGSAKMGNHNESGKKANRNVTHVKYIVKSEELIIVKVEICKYFTFQYFPLMEENEFMPPFEKLIEMISTSKTQNHLTSIYFDDSTFSTYHNCVNRNTQNRHKPCIRLRSYNYFDAQKDITKIVIQNFNLYEPSYDMNEKYIFPTDISNENLKINCVNDLYTMKLKGTTSLLAHVQTGSDDPNDIPNSVEKKTVTEDYKLAPYTHRSAPNLEEPIIHHVDIPHDKFPLLSNLQQPRKLQHVEKCIYEIKKNNLSSCLKSKLNRFHFGNDTVNGYIDENISYWKHTDIRSIHGSEEVDSEEEENSQLGKFHEEESYDEVTKSSNHLLHKSGTNEGESVKRHRIRKGSKEYAYFDYAVIDISIQEGTNREFLSHLNNLEVLREIWGFSSYMQGISMIYPKCISTSPHWRIFTGSKYAELGDSVEADGADGADVANEEGKRKERKVDTRNGTLEGNQNDETNSSEDDNDTDASSIENVMIYADCMNGKNCKTKKDDYRKGITYTGASARIAHESEVMYRSEIERTKPSHVPHINLSIGSANSGVNFNHRRNYMYDSLNADTNSQVRKSCVAKGGRSRCRSRVRSRDRSRSGSRVRSRSGSRGRSRSGSRVRSRSGSRGRSRSGSRGRSRRGEVSIQRQALTEDNNLFEPLLDEVEDTNWESKKSSPSSCKILSFFKSLFFRKNKIVESKRPKTSVVRVEPKTFFANERTLLQWLNTSVLLSTISITLLNFSNSYGFASGIIMAPVAIFFILYSFHIYLKRAEALINKEPINYTDKVGPGVLVITLTFALSTVVILNIYSRLKGEV